MENISYLPNRLREERKKLGLTQLEVAERCGISLKMWGNYERGKNSPGAEVFFHLTEMGFDVSYIFSGVRSSPVVSTYSAPSFKSAPATVLHENKAVYVVGGGEHLNEREKQLVEDFRSANEQGQAAIEGAAKAMARVAALEAFKAG